MKVTPTTATINKDGMQNTVSVDRATVAPTVKETLTEYDRTQTDENEAT